MMKPSSMMSRRKKLKVLVVGGGESGADISAELGELSPNVTVWLRRPICVGPRYLNKRNEMQQVEANMTVDFPANGFLEAATTNRMSAGQNVYAYGFFRIEFPWIHLPGKELLSPNPRSWFLNCFPEGLGHCLCFLGYARPHQGGVPVLAEMLSRYIALLLHGERDLPPDYSAEARRDAAASREYYSLSPSLLTLIDYNAFLESVARRIGCEPRLPVFCILLFNFHMVTVLLLALQFCCSAPRLLSLHFTLQMWALSMASFFILYDGLPIKWWFYPHWAVWYRQRGPNANPALLHGVLKQVNLWTSTAITSGFVLLVLWSIPTYYAQRILSVVLFASSAIPTALGIHLPEAWGILLRPKLFSLHGCPWRMSDLYMP
ncbi:uncharacterized protein A1O5_01990 [Cladophialophora psammophila CBS 110553]|uniref:FAD/NAD(P)-binding domain-containing protein n=1 Tax=Cladophialophora psammophila CBS 110553 TaxID=1182543 RepID=W9XYC0_9EURO|nr:uncharacterized protein A1O5_01990 [Cladophialophora psammophila CBS 110553]EXJ75294.1 hypothetical protein A1O5_01990 [Cladophialophora psammophila CBS 110553]